jgi:hypothetical protein
VFIVQVLKVLCFDTLLQVFILKVDSGRAGGLAEFFAPSILFRAIFLGNVGRKGVRWLVEYFMGYYTIWLAPVKRNFVPFWEFAPGWRMSAAQPSELSPKPGLVPFGSDLWWWRGKPI